MTAGPNLYVRRLIERDFPDGPSLGRTLAVCYAASCTAYAPSTGKTGRDPDPGLFDGAVPGTVCGMPAVRVFYWHGDLSDSDDSMVESHLLVVYRCTTCLDPGAPWLTPEGAIAASVMLV